MRLTPSQRVNVMKEIANQLGSESYSLIDLTLQQFALPVTDSWSGTNIVHLPFIFAENFAQDCAIFAPDTP